MANPYQSPFGGSGDPGHVKAIAKQRVTSPAVGLMVVSGLSVGLLVFTVPLDVFLLSTGAIPDEANGLNPNLTIGIRILWGLVIMAVSGFTFYAAWNMNQLKSYGLARTGAILACVPCLGPCCLLGIPFGVWALVTLNDPSVKASFEETGR